MNLDATRWFAGVDWGRRRHEVCLIDSEGEMRAANSFEHGAAKVLTDAVGTDPQAFRCLAATDPDVAELSELTQTRRQLIQDRIRARERLKDMLWQYFPVLAEISSAIASSR